MTETLPARGSLRSRAAALASTVTLRQLSTVLPPEQPWGLWAPRRIVAGVADARHLAADISAGGGRCTLQIWPDQVHVFQALPRLSPEAGKAMRQVAGFIDISMRDNEIEAITGKAG